MDGRRVFTLTSASLLVAAPLFAGSAADYGAERGVPSAGQTDYDTAQVLSAEPLLRQVRFSVPERECHVETHYVPVDARRAGAVPAAGQMFIGGLIGAVVGHQIDSRHSHNTGTVAGALIGTAIGHQAAQDSAYRNQELRAVDAERCEVHAVERVEERIDGYRVTYRYNGRVYSTQMPHDPGSTLRVRVNVAPVG